MNPFFMYGWSTRFRSKKEMSWMKKDLLKSIRRHVPDSHECSEKSVMKKINKLTSVIHGYD